ncbi:MAG: winged helix-turn-helix transcriptional regulator [Desulfobacter sp.]|nr:MAG: winged helix-turn-helix transcriptional regulator [Desulfobacter sp.]
MPNGQAVAVKTGERAVRGRLIHRLFLEVYSLHGCLAAITDRVHEQAGMGTPQRRLMKVLEKENGVTVPRVALSLGISRQSVQKTANSLMAAGYIRNTENPMHKRSKLLVLTEAGRQALDRAREKEAIIIEQVLPDLDPGQADVAAELLEKIRKKIEAVQPKDNQDGLNG